MAVIKRLTGNVGRGRGVCVFVSQFAKDFKLGKKKQFLEIFSSGVETLIPE